MKRKAAAPAAGMQAGTRPGGDRAARGRGEGKGSAAGEEGPGPHSPAPGAPGPAPAPPAFRHRAAPQPPPLPAGPRSLSASPGGVRRPRGAAGPVSGWGRRRSRRREGKRRPPPSRFAAEAGREAKGTGKGREKKAAAGGGSAAMRTPRRRSHTDRSAALCARPRLRGGGRSVLPANRRASKLPPPSRSPIAARRAGPRPPPRSANHKIDTAESQSKGREGTPSLEGPSFSLTQSLRRTPKTRRFGSSAGSANQSSGRNPRRPSVSL